MTAAIDFVVAARNAARNIVVDEARQAAAAVGVDIQLPQDADLMTRHLCLAIKAVLKILPELPVGSRGPAGEALKKLALTLDTSARIFSIAEGPEPPAISPAREINPDDIPYRPGVDRGGGAD